MFGRKKKTAPVTPGEVIRMKGEDVTAITCHSDGEKAELTFSLRDGRKVVMDDGTLSKQSDAMADHLKAMLQAEHVKSCDKCKVSA